MAGASPRLLADEAFACVSRDARLMYLLLPYVAEDSDPRAFHAEAQFLADACFPHDDDVSTEAIAALLQELAAAELITLRTDEGELRGYIVGRLGRWIEEAWR